MIEHFRSTTNFKNDGAERERNIYPLFLVTEVSNIE